MSEIKKKPVPNYPDRYVPETIADIGAVRELHKPRTHYYPDAWPDHSYQSYEEYAELIRQDGDEPEPVEALSTFVVCAECARIEESANQDADEWTYLEAIWPCQTAKTLGVAA